MAISWHDFGAQAGNAMIKEKIKEMLNTDALVDLLQKVRGVRA